ncbi:MAG TPA: SAM-dependent methyltransferase [Coxiellaceae bacterium]|nr:SAM-dependent methyltransferase [Coxiellaceae bacterium]
MVINNKIIIIPTCDSVLKKAQELSTHLRLPLITQNQLINNFAFLLAVTPDHLELRENNVKNSKPIFVDFLAASLNWRIKHGGGKKQLIAKAIGIKGSKKPYVIDATAGFGIDAFVLASLGCEVVMLERSPIIAALLEDGLKRLKKDPKNQTLKISLQTEQSATYINKLIKENREKPDVIYLDPMYPKRSKNILNKKTMRVLHEIVGNDDDASELLNLALNCAKNRVVVKRPNYADNLGLLKPDLQFSSKGSCRYDIYFPKTK